jgi:hypothetical protein
MKSKTQTESDDRIEQRIREGHQLQGCARWETWTETNVPLMEGGRANITFDGCKQHSVAIAR